MAKKIIANVKVQIPAGKATPAPPVGPALAQFGLNISEFCQKFNEITKGQEGKLPVEITVFADRTYAFHVKQPMTSHMIKKMLGIEKGSGTQKITKVGKITQAQIKEIAQKKMVDLNTTDIKAAMRTVEGTAIAMGLEIEK
jgi:large subunit ribosomal protein L11